MRTVYSVASIEPARRFEYWVDAVCSHCIPAACKQLSGSDFNGSLTTSSLGSVEISEMIAPLHLWSREATHIRRSSESDLWLASMASGRALVSQNNRQARLDTGDLVLYDAARPFEFTLETTGIYLVRLPRNLIVNRLPRAERFTAQVVRGSDPIVGLLHEAIKCAVTLDFGKMRPDAAAQFATTLLDLVTLMLKFQMGDVEPSLDRNLYHRIMTYIAREFEDPDLCLAELAKAHHVSPRTVTRVFARHQQTAMGTVWHMRLEASRNALNEGRARSVKEAAFAYGFSDTSHFSRAFRKVFGCAPSTLLRSTRV